MVVRTLIALAAVLALVAGCTTTLTFDLKVDQPFTLEFTEPVEPTP